MLVSASVLEAETLEGLGTDREGTMRRLRKLALAGASLTAGLTLSVGVASATPADTLRDCIDLAVQEEDVAAAVHSCVAAYLAGGDTSADDFAVNTGALGSASDGGVNTAILGSAEGEGAVNTAILGSASTS